VFPIRADLFTKSVLSVFPNSRNNCPDAGQTAREQHSLLRFPEQFAKSEYAYLMAPVLHRVFRIHTSDSRLRRNCSSWRRSKLYQKPARSRPVLL